MNEVIAVMAAVYITYVVVESHLPPVAWARDWILDDSSRTTLYLLTCWWCTGFWAAAVVVLGLWLYGTSLDVPVLLVPASALVAGLTGQVYGVLEMTHANLVKGLNGD